MIRTGCRVVGWTALAVMVSLAGACNDDKGYSGGGDDACGQGGQQVSASSRDFCVYDSGLIIEGFECPPTLEQRFDFEDFAVCTDGELTDEFRQEMDRQGRELEPLESEPGGTCDRPGARTPASDGCNTCTCEDGAWACTEIGCGGGEGCGFIGDEASCEEAAGCVWAECQGDDCGDGVCFDVSDVNGQCAPEGLVVSDVDGCGNSCSCTGGAWLCSQAPCFACEGITDRDTCEGSGQCAFLECPQDDFSCPTPTGTACRDLAEPGEACEDFGGSVPAADGCNSCFCEGGTYSCTEIACGG